MRIRNCYAEKMFSYLHDMKLEIDLLENSVVLTAANLSDGIPANGMANLRLKEFTAWDKLDRVLRAADGEWEIHRPDVDEACVELLVTYRQVAVDAPI